MLSVALATGVALLGAEVGLRLFAPPKMQPRIWRPSPTHSFTLEPGAVGRHRTAAFDVTYHIGAQGYHSPPFAVPKDPRGRRVLAIGDSFTFGHGVEDDENYPAVMRRALAPGAEVINGGYVSGMAPDDAYVYLGQALTRLEPDVVVHGITVWNDVGDVFEHTWGLLDERGLPTWTRSTRNAVNALGTRGPLPWFYRVPGLRASHLWIMLGKGTLRLAPAADAAPSLRLNRSLYQADFADPAYAEAFERAMRCLAGCAARSRQHDVRYLVVLIPFVSQVTPDAFNADFYTSVPPEQRDLRQPQARMRAYLESAGVPVFDLAPALRPVGRAAYLAGDDHWNPRGHAVAGAAIARELRRRWPTRVGAEAGGRPLRSAR